MRVSSIEVVRPSAIFPLTFPNIPWGHAKGLGTRLPNNMVLLCNAKEETHFIRLTDSFVTSMLCEGRGRRAQDKQEMIWLVCQD